MAKERPFTVTIWALTVILMVGIILADRDAVAETGDQPSPETLQARREFH